MCCAPGCTYTSNYKSVRKDVTFESVTVLTFPTK